MPKKFLIVIDERGFYRLLKSNGDSYDEVIDMVKANSKEEAKEKFIERLFHQYKGDTGLYETETNS